MDPARHPAFFYFAFLCFNTEWWLYSIVFLGILELTAKGINKQSDRKTVNVIMYAVKVAKRLPITDIVMRIVLIIISTLIATKDTGHTITGYFIRTIYSLFKYFVFCLVYSRMLYPVDGNLVSKEDSVKSGSTVRGLKIVKRKVLFLARLCGLGVLLYGYNIYAFIMTL